MASQTALSKHFVKVSRSPASCSGKAHYKIIFWYKRKNVRTKKKQETARRKYNAYTHSLGSKNVRTIKMQTSVVGCYFWLFIERTRPIRNGDYVHSMVRELLLPLSPVHAFACPALPADVFRPTCRYEITT